MRREGGGQRREQRREREGGEGRREGNREGRGEEGEGEERGEQIEFLQVPRFHTEVINTTNF